MGLVRSTAPPDEPSTRRRSRVGLMSVGAALLYGGWALGVNWTHGAGMAWRAAGTQAAFSFVATLVMSSIMEAVFVRRPPGAGRIAFTAAVPSLLGVGVLLGAHALAGTPELLLTILPSAVVGLGFSTAYSLNLARVEGGEPRHDRVHEGPDGRIARSSRGGIDGRVTLPELREPRA